MREICLDMHARVEKVWAFRAYIYTAGRALTVALAMLLIQAMLIHMVTVNIWDDGPTPVRPRRLCFEPPGGLVRRPFSRLMHRVTVA
jgi:hypothetical protein